MPHNYSDVQFISYEVQTLNPFIVAAWAKEDVLRRAQILFNVMGFCHNQLVNDQDTTLKIFVAPEFYGRFWQGQSNGFGHYSINQVLNAINTLKSSCAGDSRFKHWLILPGSYVAAEFSGRYEVFNFINVFMGDRSVERVIHKKNFSNIDKLDMGLRKGNKAYQFFSGEIASTQFRPIRVANLQIGLEVCLDHWSYRLRNYYFNKDKTSIDVHVLSACGRPAILQSILTKKDGYFFRNDGSPDFWGSEDRNVQWPDITGSIDRPDDAANTTFNPLLFQQPLAPSLQVNPKNQSRVTIYGVHPI